MRVALLILALSFGCAFTQVTVDETGECRYVRVQTLMRHTSVECYDGYVEVEHKPISLNFSNAISAVVGFVVGIF